MNNTSNTLGKRIIASWLAVLATIAAPLAAQVSADYYRSDGKRYVCSQQEVLYDDFFHAARFAIAATTDGSGTVSYTLEVTYDEGLLDVARGDSLTLVLRGGDRIVLKTDRAVTKGDILKRHYRSYNDYYVTCHYMMSAYDIQRLARNRTNKLSAQTQRFTFDRKLDKFQDRFTRQFTAVYRRLTGYRQ